MPAKSANGPSGPKKQSRVPTSQRVSGGIQKSNRPKPAKLKPGQPVDLTKCRNAEFSNAEEVQSFVRRGAHFLFPVGVDGLSTEFAAHHFALHQVGAQPVLSTKAGWAMLPDQNSTGMMRTAVEAAKQGVDALQIAREGLGMEQGYCFFGPGRWKNQPVGQGTKTRPDAIVDACWAKPSSLHVDLREREDVHNFACLVVAGPYPRHMVVTDLGILDEERATLVSKRKAAQVSGDSAAVARLDVAKQAMFERHMAVYGLMRHVEASKAGFYSDFNADERLLMHSVLRAVEIRPGQAFVFPQHLPHCLTDSRTSEDPEARALTFYTSIKFSTCRETLGAVQRELVDLFAEGGQHVYQKKLGKNGFTDAAINEEHIQKIRPCVLRHYGGPPADGGKNGFGAGRPFPTLREFVSDVRAARADPQAFPEGMTCEDLDLDRVLLPREAWESAMEIREF